MEESEKEADAGLKPTCLQHHRHHAMNPKNEYRVELKRSAAKYLESLPRRDLERIA